MSVLVNNNHPIFEDNQVLTSGQLNQLTNYLDQQTRLTRSCLIGMGIACGLELELETNGHPAVIIHQGMGISSEGFLLKLCPERGSCTTVQYREYNLPEGVVYTPFQDEEFNQDIALYELLTSEAEVGDDVTVKPLSSPNNFLQNKVVLLFLECLDKDLKSCLGKSCDELGIERIFTLRKLVISVDDLKKVNARTNGGRQDDLFIEKFNLKDISLPRVFQNMISTAQYFPFAFKYVEAIQKVDGRLKELLNETYKVYEPILADIYDGNPFQSAVIEEKFKKLDEYLVGGFPDPTWWGIQYVYDFYQDLILAYKEFKDCAYDLMVQCCPDMTRFPRHLMLGKVVDGSKDECEVNVFRHSFTQPPIYNHQNYLLAKTQSLHKRIVLLIENFAFDRLHPENSKEVEPKATPSCEKKSWLSKRSIPFYYDSKAKSSFDKLENLEMEWSFVRKHRKCQIQEEDKVKALNMSYDNNLMEKDALTPLTTPLHFDMDAYNFLRLEGMQGKGIETALQGLRAIKHKANIDFDVKAIYFGDEFPEGPELECLMDDLQLDYEVWRNKFLYLLDGFARITNVSRFLTTQKVTGKTKGKRAQKDKMGMEPLHQETQMMRNMNVGLNKDNWAYALEEVHFQTKAVNVRGWASKQGGTVGINDTFNDNRGVGELHEQIRNCLIAIRANTPENLRSFDLERWLPTYKCPLDVFTELIKVLAARIPRGSFTMKLNTFMKLICALHELLRNLFIYPYIEARLISNTLQKRQEQHVDNHEFFNFLRMHPGLEHKAGVEQGQTFVLLTQLNYSDKAKERMIEMIQKFLDEHPDFPIKVDDVLRFEKDQFGKVLADFTLPYKCCDPCSTIRPQVAELDPIAVPICEVVPIRENPDIEGKNRNRFEYVTLKEKLFHTVYEPERYRAHLTSDATLGTASLQFIPFDYDPNKNTQIFTYEVDIEKVIQAATKSESDYLVDVINYEFRYAGSDHVIDKSTITVLIPIIFPTESKPLGFQGLVYSEDEAGNRVGVPAAEVWVNLGENEVVNTLSDDKGSYQLIDPRLVNGIYTVNAFAAGFMSTVVVNVSIDNEVVPLNIKMNPLPVFGIDEKRLLTHLTLNENSKEAILINKERKDSIKMYEDAIERSIEAERNNANTLMKVKEVISRFNHDDDLTVAELNTLYSKHRDVLLREIEAANTRVTKKNRSNALKVLTNSYMDRLVLKEPEKFSTDSNKILGESAKLLERSKVTTKTHFSKWAKRKEKVVGKNVMKKFRTKFKFN